MQLHPSHQPAARQATRAVAVLLLLLIVTSALPALPGMQGVAHYLPLHLALETLAIVMAALTFGVVWSARHEQLPRNVLVLACGFFGVALLDFSHMLSYAGMPDFVTHSSPEKAIHFWLRARLLSALILLSVAWLSWSVRASPHYAPLLVTCVLLLVTLLHWLFLFAPQLLPETFRPGEVLTRYNITF